MKDKASIPKDSPPLCVESVFKRFRLGNKEVVARNGVNLAGRSGEFVAIMGGAESGKSTLLHAMAGLTDVDAVRVLLDGQDLGTMSDAQLTRFRRRRIGLVFQAFNLIPTLTAEDNATLPCEDGRAAKARLEPLLDELGLGSRRHHKPDALSGGEQQRVAIARALISDPAIRLADEPTGSLDSVSGQQVCALLERLCRTHGRTIVIVPHEPHVALSADRVVVIKDGRNLAEFATGGNRPPRPQGRSRDSIGSCHPHDQVVNLGTTVQRLTSSTPSPKTRTPLWSACRPASRDRS